MSLTDREKVCLLRAALADLRPRLATLPMRQHVDDLLRLTDDPEFDRTLHSNSGGKVALNGAARLGD